MKNVRCCFSPAHFSPGRVMCIILRGARVKAAGRGGGGFDGSLPLPPNNVPGGWERAGGWRYRGVARGIGE